MPEDGSTDTAHDPVMLEQICSILDPKAGQVAADCTVGLGGHAAVIGSRLGSGGTLVIGDTDRGNLELASGRLSGTVDCTLRPIHCNFAGIGREMVKMGLRADCVLADLGYCSNQVDDASRGLSFQSDGPLDMRLDNSRGMTAADLVASLDVDELTELIRSLGEEPLARRIAQNLVRHRLQGPISTTAQLVEIVRESYGSRARSSRMHPATKTFMALRIAVNDELSALESLLEDVLQQATLARDGVDDGRWLQDGARVAILSFHSLEDRRVKRCFAEGARRGLLVPLTQKPVEASEEEIRGNHRSRSAKLRAAMVGTRDL
ncbi:MAG: 16S rRNA (cytosine(1402)-N(4))-methyltransferase [Phycisphaerae bacterium]|nr:16S rRNA (cytosine(1402)-N(4))-methyltransferase [Phycisphaerae bacterium]